MKTLILFFVLLFTGLTFAQTGINYKAVVKDGSGDILANQEIDVEFTIIKNVGVVEVYKELHEDVMTDANGIIILTIGQGDPSIGIYSLLNMGNDRYFLKTQIDIGSGLVDIGTTEFNEVPFAATAKTISESPSRTLNVAGDGSQRLLVNSLDGNTSSLELRRTGADTDWRLQNSGNWLDMQTSDNDFSTLQIKFSFNKDGKLGVNNDFPAEELHVTGTIRSTDLSGTGTRNITADANGNIVTSTPSLLKATNLSGSGTRNVGATSTGTLVIKEPTTQIQYLSLNTSMFNSRIPAGGLPAETAIVTPNFLTGTGGISFDGNIGLPNGAIITRMRVYFKDNSPTSDISFHLYRVNNNGISQLELANLSYSGSNPANLTLQTEILNHTINNILYSYALTVFSNNWTGFTDMRVTGIVITYTLP